MEELKTAEANATTAEIRRVGHDGKDVQRKNVRVPLRARIIGDRGSHRRALIFFRDRRSDPPIVPACAKCNGIKATLEHHLATVLPFGGQHADAGENLATQVQRRLAKNVSLARTLQSGMSLLLVSDDWGNTWHQAATMPADGEQFVRICRMIAKGLAFFHWNMLLPEADCDIHAAFMRPDGEAIVHCDGHVTNWSGSRKCRRFGSLKNRLVANGR